MKFRDITQPTVQHNPPFTAALPKGIHDRNDGYCVAATQIAVIPVDCREPNGGNRREGSGRFFPHRVGTLIDTGAGVAFRAHATDSVTENHSGTVPCRVHVVDMHTSGHLSETPHVTAAQTEQILVGTHTHTSVMRSVRVPTGKGKSVTCL